MLSALTAAERQAQGPQSRTLRTSKAHAHRTARGSRGPKCDAAASPAATGDGFRSLACRPAPASLHRFPYRILTTRLSRFPMVAGRTRVNPQREQAREEAEAARRKSSYRLYAPPRERRPANPGDRARHGAPWRCGGQTSASDSPRVPRRYSRILVTPLCYS